MDSKSYNKNEYPPQEEEARRWWFDHDSFKDFDICQDLLVTVHDAIDDAAQASTKARPRPTGKWVRIRGGAARGEGKEKKVEENAEEEGKGKKRKVDEEGKKTVEKVEGDRKGKKRKVEEKVKEEGKG